VGLQRGGFSKLCYLIEVILIIALSHRGGLTMEHTPLDWVALGVVIFGTIAAITVFLVVHEIPYKVAKKRAHPHCDAIHAACWISVFTGGLIWPLTLIWAYLGTPQLEVKQVVDSTSGAAV
jgi:hypothetical protein